ncbi:MAG: universal stress protein [Thaumarchaeota archaeon]|nr:universal stress protein [Nitrososphaerota archaeon]
MKLSRIMAAVDGSKSSERAAKVAMDVAKTMGASLFLLEVIQHPAITKAGPGARAAEADVVQYMELAKSDAEEFIGRLEAAAKASTVRVRGEVEENVPSVVQAIVEYADEWEVDLIVVGTRGLTGFKKILLGSVSGGVVAHAPCSVLVVR